MGEVLAELEQVLRFSEKEKITLDEELALQKCKARAVNTFLISAGISSALVWGARGTRMQRELAKIVMTKNLQNPSSAVSKIFYPEHVYDDSTQEKPLIRWRVRNLYEDNVVVADSPKDSPPSSKDLPSDSEPSEHTWKTSGDTIAGLGDLITDPLDCILGYPETGGEAPGNAGVVSRRELGAHRRRQRRRRRRHEKNYRDQSSPEILTV